MTNQTDNLKNQLNKLPIHNADNNFADMVMNKINSLEKESPLYSKTTQNPKVTQNSKPTQNSKSSERNTLSQDQSLFPNLLNLITNAISKVMNPSVALKLSTAICVVCLLFFFYGAPSTNQNISDFTFRNGSYKGKILKPGEIINSCNDSNNDNNNINSIIFLSCAAEPEGHSQLGQIKLKTNTKTIISNTFSSNTFANNTVTNNTSIDNSLKDKTHLILEKGEAYFELSLKGRRFQINTFAGDVIVFGTAFSINVSDKYVNVAVTEGVVTFKNLQGEVKAKAGQTIKATDINYRATISETLYNDSQNNDITNRSTNINENTGDSPLAKTNDLKIEVNNQNVENNNQPENNSNKSESNNIETKTNNNSIDNDHQINDKLKNITNKLSIEGAKITTVNDTSNLEKLFN